MELKDMYYKALVASRPCGQIWEVKPNSVTDRKIKVLAGLLADVHLDAERLIDESIPSTTRELLPEWEKKYGLSGEGSYVDRLAALAAAARPTGPQSKEYYLSVAKAYEVEIEIIEHVPVLCGYSQCGDDSECGNEDMVYYWEVVITAAPSDERVEAMKTAFNKHKQAHTDLAFIDARTVPQPPQDGLIPSLNGDGNIEVSAGSYAGAYEWRLEENSIMVDSLTEFSDTMYIMLIQIIDGPTFIVAANTETPPAFGGFAEKCLIVGTFYFNGEALMNVKPLLPFESGMIS